VFILKNNNSLIFVGSKGIGSIIKKNLENRGDTVVSCSRHGNLNFEEINTTIDGFDINKLKIKFNNLIFSHRYRGVDSQEEYKIAVESVDKLLEKSNKFLKKIIEKLTPLQRMGNVQDIANLVTSLCSDKSSFITGQVIIVDGGISLHSSESIGKTLYNE